MKVAIDLRPLQIGHERRGIGAYLMNILERLPSDENITYIFLRYDTSDPIKEFALPFDAGYKEITFKKFDFSKHPVQLLKFSIGLILPKFMPLIMHRPDVYFQTDYLLGVPHKLLVKRRVTTCYDIIPLKFPSMYIPKWTSFAAMRHIRLRSRIRMCLRAIYYRSKYKHGIRALKKSDTILSISRTTTNDLEKMLGITEHKIKTIYLAPSFRGQHAELVNEQPRKNFLFYIGGGDKRRQIQHLISAFNKLNGRGYGTDLVLAGYEFSLESKELRHDLRKAIETSSYRKQIKLLGTISDDEKFSLMKTCKAFIYPSLYEGFGMPVVEAMAVKTPVITYDNSSISEIAQDTVLYAHESSDGIFDAIVELTSMSEQKIALLTDRAYKRSREFDWSTTSAKTVEELMG